MEVGSTISVSLAVKVDSMMELGGFINNERENGEVPTVLRTCLLYEYVRGCMYRSKSVW